MLLILFFLLLGAFVRFVHPCNFYLGAVVRFVRFFLINLGANVRFVRYRICVVIFSSLIRSIILGGFRFGSAPSDDLLSVDIGALRWSIV